MRQEILINPNNHYPLVNYNMFRKDSRHLMNMLRSTGVDKSIRNDMRVFLAKTETLMKTNRKSMFKELTKSAHPNYIGGMDPETMGTYYPDEIPVDTYYKMKQDPQIALGLAIIKMPIIGLKWVVDCEDKDVAAFITEAMSMVWKRLMKSMLTAVDFGFASHEKVWWLYPMDIYSTTATGRKKTHFSGKAEIYKKIKAHYPDSIRIRTDSKTGDFIGILQDLQSEQFSLDKDKCFLFSLEDEFGNYFGGSRLKQAYKPWYWKEVLYQFMMRYYERRGSPPTVVTYPIGYHMDASGAEIDNCTVALKVGQSLIENSVVTLPYEETKDGRENQWKVEYLHDEKRGEMFIECITHLETQVLRGLLVPERVVTQDISTGSYSMASSHAEAFLLAQEGLISDMEDAINTQLIPPLVEFNFKPKSGLVCRINIEEVEHDRKKILKEIYVEIIRNINTFAKAGMVPNLLPSLSEIGKVLKIPMAPFIDEYVPGLIDTSDDNEVTKLPKDTKDDDKVSKSKKKGDKADKSNVIPIKKSASIKRNPVILN